LHFRKQDNDQQQKFKGEEEMTQDFGTPVSPVEPPKKSNNTLLIVIIVLVVLCCCCAVVIGGGWWLWNNGDRFLGISQQTINLLV
jgi:hypothetical protein